MIIYNDGREGSLPVDLDVDKGTGFLLYSICSGCSSVLLSVESLDFLNSSNLLFNTLNSDLDDTVGGGVSSKFSSSTS